MQRYGDLELNTNIWMFSSSVCCDSNLFTTSALVNHCGVSQRNAEKIVERWKNEGYIVMRTYGLYEKVILDLM